ncbi:hypothetical protein Tco_1110417 [Tanacetum coccineum]|uniref:Uncharacterized protein n=1 Tax=Tanacetum coccineum TaxID=301880 RepID=A0ABQ5IJ02_9ASTR
MDVHVAKTMSSDGFLDLLPSLCLGSCREATEIFSHFVYFSKTFDRTLECQFLENVAIVAYAVDRLHLFKLLSEFNNSLSALEVQELDFRKFWVGFHGATCTMLAVYSYIV